MDVYCAYNVVAHGGTNYHTDYNLMGVYANPESAQIACQQHCDKGWSNWVIKWEETKSGDFNTDKHYGYWIKKMPLTDLVKEPN